jgi:two-component sensor histidine kinase
VKELLREHEELARMLLKDAEAGHCEMGTRRFDELESLRDLNEPQELQKAKWALEEVDVKKDLVMKELNHSVKNSLQIVPGLLQLQARAAASAASQLPGSRETMLSFPGCRSASAGGNRWSRSAVADHWRRN